MNLYRWRHGGELQFVAEAKVLVAVAVCAAPKFHARRGHFWRALAGKMCGSQEVLAHKVSHCHLEQGEIRGRPVPEMES